MKTKTTIMIEEEILKELKKIAIDKNLSYGEAIQKAIENYIMESSP